VWKSFGGTTEAIDGHLKLPMVKLNHAGTGTDNNEPVHAIRVRQGTLLAGAMGLTKKAHDLKQDTQGTVSYHGALGVNSIHGYVVDSRAIPQSLEISATADDASESPEGFESQHGAPILGPQWHPEADFDRVNYNTQILSYMALAGDAYVQKRRCLEELFYWRDRMSTVNN
jgi:gamma-glutamyl-gamma-aminobutyrate hydrolase PuuD